MKSWLCLFNIFLSAVAAGFAGGCTYLRGLSTHKDYATLNFFLEGRPADSLPVQVGWNKTTMYIEAEPVLTEDDLSQAKLVDNADGTYEIQLTFTGEGAMKLQMQTIGQQSKHLVILSAFPPEGPKQESQKGAPATGDKPLPEKHRDSAWLAAVLIPANGFSNGSLRFQPAASHAEAERIVLGVNKRLTALHK